MKHHKPALFLLAYILFLFIFPSFIFNQVECINVAAYRNFLVYAILMIFSLCLFWKDLFNEFKEIESGKKYFKQIIIWTLSAFILINILGSFIPSEGVSQNEAGVRAALTAHPLIMLIPVVLFGPFVEEIVFRYILVGRFPGHKWLGIFLSSLLFGLLHITSGDFIFLYVYMLMGLILGIFYHRNQNIWFSVGVHILNNLVASLISFL